MREQRTKAQVKKKNKQKLQDNTHPLSPVLHPVIITFSHGKIVKIYIVYEIEISVNISSYPTLENCLFGAVKLTKHTDVDLYKY